MIPDSSDSDTRPSSLDTLSDVEAAPPVDLGSEQHGRAASVEARARVRPRAPPDGRRNQVLGKMQSTEYLGSSSKSESRGWVRCHGGPPPARQPRPGGGRHRARIRALVRASRRSHRRRAGAATITASSASATLPIAANLRLIWVTPSRRSSSEVAPRIDHGGIAESYLVRVARGSDCDACRDEMACWGQNQYNVLGTGDLYDRGKELLDLVGLFVDVGSVKPHGDSAVESTRIVPRPVPSTETLRPRRSPGARPRDDLVHCVGWKTAG